MNSQSNRINLEFKSQLKATEYCVLALGFLRNLLNINDDDFFKIEISLREMINNAIIHGNKAIEDLRVFVLFKWSRQFIRIIIKDQNPERLDLSKIVEKLEYKDVLSSRGRGILISKSYMDKLEFSSSDQGTEVIMEKKL